MEAHADIRRCGYREIHSSRVDRRIAGVDGWMDGPTDGWMDGVSTVHVEAGPSFLLHSIRSELERHASIPDILIVTMESRAQRR